MASTPQHHLAQDQSTDERSSVVISIENKRYKSISYKDNSELRSHKSSYTLLPLSESYRLKDDDLLGKRSYYRRVNRWLLLIAVIAVMAVSVNAIASVNTMASSHAITKVSAEPDWDHIGGAELWVNDPAGQTLPAPLSQASDMQVHVSGLLAHVRLKQQFTNPSAEWVEGQYLFPLPEKAAIHHFEINVGDRTIVGSIKEKQQARQLYQAAKAAGKKAGMLTQQRPNLFTTQLANIAPYEQIEVVIEYVEQVAYQDGQFSLRLPTTLTPRYLASMPDEKKPHSRELNSSLSTLTQGWHPHQAVSAPFTQASQAGRMTLNVRLDMDMPLVNVDSLYHRIQLSKEETRYQVQLADGPALMDRDVVMTWRASVQDQPLAGLFRQQWQGSEYGLLMVVPPSAEEHTEIQQTELPKEVVYIIDTSGSMAGPSIRQAKKALSLALSRLRPIDQFNIVAFNNQTKALFNTPAMATPRHLGLAQRFVEQLEAEGGTEMRPALLRALQQRSGEQDTEALVRQVIFITDGAVSNEQDLMRLMQSQLADQRLFTVGIGSAPNSYFMRKVAELGRGSFTYVGQVQDVEAQVGLLFRQLERPQMQDLLIEWPEGAEVEQYPQRIPDLYAGQPVLVVFKARDLQGEITINGRLADKAWQQNFALTEIATGEEAPSEDASTEGLHQRWAREKIASLLDQRSQGVSQETIREQVLPLSLSHQVMSPFTRFIAIEDKPVRPAAESLHQQAVANGLPQGSQRRVMQYPNTSIGINLLLIQSITVLSVFIGLLMYWYRPLITAAFRQLKHSP